MSIHLDLADYDGKRVEVLESIRTARPASTELLTNLVDLVGAADPNMQAGATWLLRAYLKDGASLDARQVARLGEMLSFVEGWVAQLNLCQSMRHLEVPTECAECFGDFLRNCASGTKTFVRAWAVDGFWRLAGQHETCRSDATRLLEASLGDKAASVRARARKILEEEEEL